MQLDGSWVDREGTEQFGKLRAWGEWEPESRIIPGFRPENPEPNYLWEPYWVAKGTYQGLHNTDPFIFGNCFIYSNCGQLAQNKKGLKQLDRGSVIAFGSCVSGRWVLDTVFVVSDSIWYDPLNPRDALAGKVADAFLAVTSGPTTRDPNLKKAVDYGAAPVFRLYRGARPNHPVDGMFSFFPAIAADSEAGFPRPSISLDSQYFNPNSCQSPKGATRDLGPDTRRSLWGSLVSQVFEAGLVFGTHAEIPERRAE